MHEKSLLVHTFFSGTYIQNHEHSKMGVQINKSSRASEFEGFKNV